MKQKPRLLDWRQRVGQVQELRAKLQIKKGSILVYTLIVMMIMLATALSIFAVAVREKKSAGTTAASMQAFAVADSGSEIALNKIANVSTLAEVGSCASGGIVTGSIGTGMDYTLTFYDSGGNQLLNCTDSVSAVDKVKSVGRYGGTARAIEVAVAGSGFVDNGCIEPCDINSYPEGKTCSLIKGGENICADGDGCLAYLIGKFDSRPEPQLAYLYQNRSNNYINAYVIDAGSSGTNGDTSDSLMLYLAGASVEGGVYDDYRTNERDPDKVFLYGKSDKVSPARLIICDEGTAP